MTKRGLKSEFELIGDHDGHVCQFEYVPSSRNPRAIYVVFDGRRIAERCQRGTGTWVPMMPGFEVADEGYKLSVYHDGRLIN
jgi:hypothetical protein